MLFEDGKGSGSKAEVRNEILQVSTDDAALRAAIKGDAYILACDGITIDVANYLIALMINKDGKGRDMIVTKVELAGNETEDDGVFDINLGATFSATVANSTVAIPGNINGGSNKEAGGDFYVNDGAGDMTTETGAHVAYVKKQALQNYSTELSVPGGWVVPFGQSFSVSNGKNGKFYGCIHFYYRD